jgi:hypothetical protein
MKKKTRVREEMLGGKKGEVAAERTRQWAEANRGQTTSIWVGLWAGDAHLPRVRWCGCVYRPQGLSAGSGERRGRDTWNREAGRTRATNEDSAV